MFMPKYRISLTTGITCPASVMIFAHFISFLGPIRRHEDFCQAFDKTNHSALLLKLLDRKFPVQLTDIFAQWFDISVTCVKCGNCFSHFFKFRSGVRQGGVLTPIFSPF